MIALGVARLSLQPSEFMMLTPREFFIAVWLKGYEDLRNEMPLAIQTTMIANALGAKASWYDFVVSNVPEKLKTANRPSVDVLKRKMEMVAAAFSGARG